MEIVINENSKKFNVLKLKFIPGDPIDRKSELTKPLSEPVLVRNYVTTRRH